jgi:hypothetical protein
MRGGPEIARAVRSRQARRVEEHTARTSAERARRGPFRFRAHEIDITGGVPVRLRKRLGSPPTRPV